MDDVTRFGTYLTEEKRASRNTVTSYLRDVSQFADYLCNYQDCNLRQAKSEMIQNYMDWMQGHGKSASSVTRFLASIKSFYNFLLAEGSVASNPAKGLAAARTERKYPEILTSREVELFLDQPQCIDAKGFRDHAMLELLYATGIRVSELISLNLDDLNLYAGFVRCRGKKERIIPLYHGAVKALQDYVKSIRPQLIADSGEGFSEEVLKKLRHFAAVREGDEELGVGIQNAVERLDLLYEERVGVEMRNALSGGAVVELFLPMAI